MNITAETLGMKITRLKSMVAECPVPAPDTPQEIKHILKTTPQMLRDLEMALHLNDARTFGQMHEALLQTESLIEWAVGVVKGQVMGEAIKSGKAADPSLPAEQRLLNRITQFLLTKIDGPLYTSLVREFAGEDAIQGNTVYLDPGEESESISVWMTHDIKLPGESERVIDAFAKAEAAKLPQDEQDLLKAQQADRPSIYKVRKIGQGQVARGKEDTYLVQDLLSPCEVIRIHDKTSSRSLQPGAIFSGRIRPKDASNDHLYITMGTICEFPPKLWALLSPVIDQWSREFAQTNPNPAPHEFFRSHHAKLRGEVRDIVAAHAKSKEKDAPHRNQKGSDREERTGPAHKRLQQLTMNRHFIEDFLAADAPCFAMGVIEEGERPCAFLALRTGEAIPDDITSKGFNFGHTVLGTSEYEVVQFIFKFYGFKSYNVLVNPNHPLVRTVMDMMIENGEYFFFAISSSGSATSFKKEIHEGSPDDLLVTFRRVKDSTTTDRQYEKAAANFAKKPDPPGTMLTWVCRDEPDYLDLTGDTIQLNPD
jgi:hypothetical protein